MWTHCPLPSVKRKCFTYFINFYICWQFNDYDVIVIQVCKSIDIIYISSWKSSYNNYENLISNCLLFNLEYVQVSLFIRCRYVPSFWTSNPEFTDKKVHFWLENCNFWPILSLWMSEFADKKSSNMKFFAFFPSQIKFAK